MSFTAPDKIVEETSQKKCFECTRYLRKIEEVEQILTGRETIITALQTQFKKCENNYKKLFDDYEQLRFDHSSALQDNFSLKQINSKLEEITVNEKKSVNDCIEKNNYSNLIPQIQRLKKQSSNATSVLPLLQKVISIEKLIKNQNHILKQLIEKVIKELKCYKGDNSTDIEDIIEEQFKEIESGDYLDSDPKFKKLQVEIEKLKVLVEEHQKENERMKKLLEKRNKGTKGINVSRSDSNINGLNSGRKDPDMTSSDKIDTDCKNTLVRMQQEMAKKEKYFEKCSCQLIEQLQDMHDNNQVLSDTLAVITAENKNNLDIINNLKAELNRANEECEEKTAAMKARINRLENEVEENQIAEQKKKESMEISENEIMELKDRMRHLMEECDKLKDCKCDAEKEYKAKLMEMEAEDEDLRKELTEKSLELTEYEEENRNLCQKIEILTNFNNELLQKIRDLEDDFYNKTKEIDKAEMSTQVSLTEVNQLQEQVTQLNAEKKCLAEKCKANRANMEETVFQLDCLKTSVKIQLDELEKLSTENEELKAEIERLRGENKLETDRLQDLVNRSQKQIEMLLMEHDEKTSQMENVANELDNIRKSVTKDNEKFENQIKQFEKEKEELRKKVQEHERCKQCNCEEGREEIEKLKAELIKKQCIILELEKSVDNFNETMKNFDKMAEELANENSTLKNNIDERDKELQELQKTMSEKIKEVDKKRETLENSKLECEKCLRSNKLLEAENEALKNDYQSILDRKRSMEMENETLRNDLKRFSANKTQLEKAFVENCQLQMELENLKQNHFRRESTVSGKLVDLQNAYDGLKNLFDQSNEENETLKNDLKKCLKSLEESKKSCGCLRTDNEVLKKQVIRMSAELESLRGDCDKFRKDCVKKCFEVECLKETVDDQKQEKLLCQEDYQKLKQKNILNEKELLELREKVDEFRKNDELKSQELKKLKKQWESCAKQSQISRDEYNNLRKEYKEIKTMLSEQIKRYKMDNTNPEPCQPCAVVNDLKQQLLEKERQLMLLQQNVKDASYEIIELKDYIHKLICDNNILKSGINNLIGNLERKIKGPSFGSLPSYSAEAIAGEILHSLSNIENKIVKNSDVCPKGCRGQNCDCMLEITSQYNESRQDTTTNKSSNTAYKSISEPLPTTLTTLLSKQLSEPVKIESGANTTDSDETQSSSFPDQKSLQFLKEAIRDLKSSVHCTMKEKSCDCEF